MEKWKTIKDAPKYEISNLARVRNKSSRLILKTAIDRYGYPKIALTRNNGSRYYATIHRLVAIAWVKGYRKGLQVNHKDGVKTNNLPSNLEWISARKNIIHSYETLLNSNTNPLTLTDIVTGVIRPFRSIKDLGRYLNIHLGTLVPLIKNSQNCPILEKYTVRLRDESKLVESSNTLNFGKSVFVYDHLTDEATVYPSVLTASYFTGVRSLRGIKTRDIVTVAGYSFSLTEWLPPYKFPDKDSILKNRLKYINTPYVPYSEMYFLYDYHTKEEMKFDSLEKMKVFINRLFPDRPVSINNIVHGISQGLKKGRNKSGLIRGFGVKSSKRNLPWHPYPEEIVIRNRLGKHFYRAYRVKRYGVEKIVFGIDELCDFVGYRPDNLSKKSTDSEIQISFNNPNLSIERLNKPIS